ncbi:MAG TPA: MarR family transcriptional regulator [Caulobacterales bacterium]|nr:MarR family transcriptional regulator [Caulobacterales bacterium]
MKERSNEPGPAHALTLAAELRSAMGKLKRRLRDEIQLGGLTWSQVAVLRVLERDGPATVTALARAEGMRPQSMSVTVSALEVSGFIVGTPDPADGRQTIWSITGVYRDWLKAGRAAREDWLFKAIRKSLTPAEQEQLATAVKLLKRLVET